MRNVFTGKQFDKRIIIEAVGLYCRFSLSYRDVSEILRHRGIQVNPTTIMRWVHQYGKLIFDMKLSKKMDTKLREIKNSYSQNLLEIDNLRQSEFFSCCSTFRYT